MIKAK